MNMRFSIGYNHDLDGFKKLVERFRKHLDSIYFPVPGRIMGSGRILYESPDYDPEKLIELAHENDITPIILLNSTVVSVSAIQRTLDYLGKLDIRRAVVTDPYLMMQIRENFPDIRLEVSMLARVRTLQEARYFKDMGASMITPDREINRDTELLRKMKKILPLKILVNEGCLKDCIHRYSHYNFLSSDKGKDPLFTITKKQKQYRKHLDRMDSMCMTLIEKHPHKIFSSPFVRPEDLGHYDGISDVFKLSTRNFDTSRIKKLIKAYVRKTYHGNLLDILNSVYTDRLDITIENSAIPKDFFEKLSGCDDDCRNCSYCREVLKLASR